MVGEGGHALRDHVAGQAELHGDAALPEPLLQHGVQATHVAQALWSKVEHRRRLFWVTHLQRLRIGPVPVALLTCRFRGLALPSESLPSWKECSLQGRMQGTEPAACDSLKSWSKQFHLIALLQYARMSPFVCSWCRLMLSGSTAWVDAEVITRLLHRYGKTGWSGTKKIIIINNV